MFTAWVPTTSVRIGDRLACLLSDAQAFPTVTGWTDKTLDLSSHGLGVIVHRVFTVRGAPWWVDDLMVTGTIDANNRVGTTLIVSRCPGTPHRGHTRERKTCPLDV